ncbi:MAG: hypothetical protein V4621_05785 [Pseudomonadota bacterium]
MTTLLTAHGIPATCLLSLNEDMRQTVDDATATVSCQCPLELDTISDKLVEIFEAWGGKYLSAAHMHLHSRYVMSGDTMFTSCLHADKKSAFDDLTNNIVTARLLCVSSDPAQFIDLTSHPEMFSILTSYGIADVSGFTGTFRAEFMDAAVGLGARIVKPDPWEFVLFDGMTPHIATPAAQDNRRALLGHSLRFQLPDTWRKRIENGDAPQWCP